ncbi:MAG: hypothetical protein VR70_05325 [Rhodospirillaceae bacterium BRH_c57]|nr:MAG: hypothetical protein VR70_05325 [Rhodospirillaceae bacterium BRH_c57]
MIGRFFLHIQDDDVVARTLIDFCMICSLGTKYLELINTLTCASYAFLICKSVATICSISV